MRDAANVDTKYIYAHPSYNSSIHCIKMERRIEMGKRGHHIREVNEVENADRVGLLVQARNPFGWCSVRN